LRWICRVIGYNTFAMSHSSINQKLRLLFLAGVLATPMALAAVANLVK
jgi:hypothetical protein